MPTGCVRTVEQPSALLFRCHPTAHENVDCELRPSPSRPWRRPAASTNREDTRGAVQMSPDDVRYSSLPPPCASKVRRLPDYHKRELSGYPPLHSFCPGGSQVPHV